VGVGNRDEPAEIAGVSHFLEHLLFKGSSTRSARDIAEGIDAVGGDLNAFTSKEYTTFHARVPAAELDFGLDTLLDVVADPGFTDAEVDAERQVILEELAWSADTPDDLVHTLLSESLFPGHPLGWEVLGSVDSVRSVRADDIRGFHDEWYRRSNIVVAVAGAIDHDALVDRIDRALASRPAGGAPRRAAPGAGVHPGTRAVRPLEQSHVALGWRAPDHRDPDRHALAVANQLLGGGWSSRLFQEIRERRGMSYSVFSSVGSYADAGSMTIYAGVSPERVDDLIGIVDGILDELAVDGPGERELDVARGGFEGATILGLEDAGTRMVRLGSNLLVRDRVVPVDEYLARVRSVTADDVRRVVRRVVEGPRALTTVGPDPT
jgi:predicted Zn-dependent peptidase